MGKKIIITGISSYIGKYIGLFFLKKGYKIIGVSRTNPFIENQNFTFVRFDLEKNIFDLDINCDIFIHVAGEGRLDLDFDIYYRKNIKIAYNIKKFLEKYKPITVFLSTHKVYGMNKSNYINENSDIVNPSNYGLSKLVAENILNNNKMIILRLPAILGRGSRGWITQLVKKMKKNEEILVFNSLFNNVFHLKDLSNFINILINKEIEHEVFLLSAQNAIESKKLVYYIKKKLQSESKIKVKEYQMYYFDNRKMIEIYRPLNVYETINLFLRDIQ